VGNFEPFLNYTYCLNMFLFLLNYRQSNRFDYICVIHPIFTEAENVILKSSVHLEKVQNTQCSIRHSFNERVHKLIWTMTV